MTADDRDARPIALGRRARRPARRDRRRPAGLPRRPRAARQHRLRQLHAGRRQRGRALDRPRSSTELGRRRSSTGRTRRAGSATRSSRTFDGRPGGPRVLLIGHMDTVFDPGTAAERPFRIEDGIAYGPGVTDMKSGLLAGLYALKALVAERGGLPFERLVVRRQPGRGDRLADARRRTSASSPRTPTSRSSSSARGRTATSSRRARGSSTCGSPSTAAPRTPASSPRRAAARSSRRPGSSATSTRSTAAGRA